MPQQVLSLGLQRSISKVLSSDPSMAFKDLASILTSICALLVSAASLFISWQASVLNRRTLSENIRPILDLDFHMDGRDTHVTLSNKGLGVAVIGEVVAKRIDPRSAHEVESHDLYRLFDFDHHFDWTMCTTFPTGRTRYLPPGKGFILFHIDETYLRSQALLDDWVTDQSIIDICHLINHQLGEMTLQIALQNARGEDLPLFSFDFRRFFPLPGTPNPRESSS